MTTEVADAGLEKLKQMEVHLRVSTTDENCGHCVFYHVHDNCCQIVEGQTAGNMVCDEWTGRPTIERVIRAYRTNAQETEPEPLTDEERSKMPASSFAWIGPKGERKLPINTPGRVRAALNAIQNWSYRGQALDIPKSARGRIKAKVCAAARRFKIKSEYCGTADADDAPTLMKRLRGMDRAALVALHTRIHKAEDYTADGLLHQGVLYALKKARR